MSLEFLLVLFAFVGNKLNQESNAKWSKRRPKRKKQGIERRGQDGTVDDLM